MWKSITSLWKNTTPWRTIPKAGEAAEIDLSRVGNDELRLAEAHVVADIHANDGVRLRRVGADGEDAFGLVNIGD